MSTKPKLPAEVITARRIIGRIEGILHRVRAAHTISMGDLLMLQRIALDVQKLESGTWNPYNMKRTEDA